MFPHSGAAAHFDHRVTRDHPRNIPRTNSSNTVPSGSFVGCRITASYKLVALRSHCWYSQALEAVNQLFINTLVAFVNTQLCVGLWFRCDRASKLSTTGSNSVIVLYLLLWVFFFFWVRLRKFSKSAAIRMYWLLRSSNWALTDSTCPLISDKAFGIQPLRRSPLLCVFIHCGSIAWWINLGCHLSVYLGAFVVQIHCLSCCLACHCALYLWGVTLSVCCIVYLLLTRQSLCTNPRCSKLRFKALPDLLYLLLMHQKEQMLGIKTIFSITKNIYLLSLPLIPRGVPSFLVPCPIFYLDLYSLAFWEYSIWNSKAALVWLTPHHHSGVPWSSRMTFLLQ